MFTEQSFNEMPKYGEFTYWFLRISNTELAVYMKDSVSNEAIQVISEQDISNYKESSDFKMPENAENYSNPENYNPILEDASKFIHRPEFKVGKLFRMNNQAAVHNDSDVMIDWFETLITGSAFIRMKRSGRNPDTAYKTVSKFLGWIRNSDFYICPGSTRYHDAEPHGLLFHSLKVYNEMVTLKSLPKFQDTKYDSIVLTSLCHDFTKIGNYESYMKNVKDENTGQWNQVSAYRWKGNPIPLGHGVASMYLITRFFNLTLEEMAAIRWHMGYYNVSERESGELADSNENFPLVLMLQFADQLSIVKY